jgi:hypothetical protein
MTATEAVPMSEPLVIPDDLLEQYTHLVKMRALWEEDTVWGWTAEINCPTKQYIALIERIARLEAERNTLKSENERLKSTVK